MLKNQKSFLLISVTLLLVSVVSFGINYLNADKVSKILARRASAGTEYSYVFATKNNSPEAVGFLVSKLRNNLALRQELGERALEASGQNSVRDITI